VEVTGAVASTERRLAALRYVVSVVEARDPWLRGRSARVPEYAVHVAQALEHYRGDLEDLRLAASLIDVGMVGVPDHILRDPKVPDSDDDQAIQEHAQIGRELVSSLDRPAISEAVAHHHERWSGHGYPDGLKGEAIPLSARILAAADAYDAMTSPRPYRAALRPHEALRALELEAGWSLDPAVVGAGLRALPAASRRIQGSPTPTSGLRKRAQSHTAPDPGRRRLWTVLAVMLVVTLSLVAAVLAVSRDKGSGATPPKRQAHPHREALGGKLVQKSPPWVSRSRPSADSSDKKSPADRAARAHRTNHRKVAHDRSKPPLSAPAQPARTVERTSTSVSRGGSQGASSSTSIASGATGSSDSTTSSGSGGSSGSTSPSPTQASPTPEQSPGSGSGGTASPSPGTGSSGSGGSGGGGGGTPGGGGTGTGGGTGGSGGGSGGGAGGGG
jgi:hypothetical protein